MCVDERITDKTLNLLTKLSKLQLIVIQGNHYILPNNTDSRLIDFIYNSSQINSIVVKGRLQIIDKTTIINALISLALRKLLI